jgi:hypothetical protein
MRVVESERTGDRRVRLVGAIRWGLRRGATGAKINIIARIQPR